MLKSMTGYAFAEHSDGHLTISAEMRSYNSRYLDIALKLPMGYASFEEKIKGLVSAAMMRGRVDVRLIIQDKSDAAVAYQVDLQRAKAYCSAAAELAAGLNLGSGAVSLEYLLGISGVILPAENRVDADSHWGLIESVVGDALSQLERMRAAEGKFIGEDLSQRIDFIERSLDDIQKDAAGMLATYRERLLARVEALTQGLVEIDQTRIAQEASILADRSDISEEIVRARSHVRQFRDIMDADEPAGRKLNFLLQEFNREFNTMGAKVGQAALAHVIVDVKSEIEKLREQVQNIE